MAQSVKRPALGSGSGHDLPIHEIIGLCSGSVGPVGFSLSLSLSLSAPPPLCVHMHTHALSLKINE